MDRPTRHRRRFHTDRIVRNLRARFIRESSWWASDEWMETYLTYGRLAKKDPWDCGHRCGLCHYDKLFYSGERRRRAEREWRKDWGV